MFTAPRARLRVLKHIDTNNFWLADLVGGPDAALGFLRILAVVQEIEVSPA